MTNTTAHTTTEVALSKLDLFAENVRRTGRGSGIEELAASIQAHGLLQSLAVRAKLDADGQPTGRYEVVAGGRRLAALKLLAKGKRLPKGAPRAWASRRSRPASAARPTPSASVCAWPRSRRC